MERKEGGLRRGRVEEWLFRATEAAGLLFYFLLAVFACLLGPL